MASRPRLGKTVDRGYGAEHRRLRKRWEPIVATGTVICDHCKQRILPGESWDLGHSDDDRSQYAGPEHRSCNRRYKAKRAAERRQRRDPDPKPWP